MREKEKHYDLIVAGGGFAGVCATMEAVRHGWKVLLIEKFNCLGGAAVSLAVQEGKTLSTVNMAQLQQFFAQ